MSAVYSATRFSEMRAELFYQYGDQFIRQVGLERLEAMPVVAASQVGLGFPKAVHEIDSRRWKGIDTARGVDGFRRPFIALRVELVSPEGIFQEFVITVHRRHSPSVFGAENLYVVSSNCIDILGVPLHFQSLFPLASLTERNLLTENSWEKLANLLLGGQIEVNNSAYKLRLKQTASSDSEACVWDTVSLDSANEENSYLLDESLFDQEKEEEDRSCSNIYSDCFLVFKRCVLS